MKHKLNTKHTHLNAWGGSFKENLPSKKLCKYASHRPHVNCSAIVDTASQEFWCTIVLRHHVLRHGHSRVGLQSSSKPKVTDLQEAVAIDQQVSWLQISVHDSCRVKIAQSCGRVLSTMDTQNRLPTSEDLVHEDIDVVST